METPDDDVPLVSVVIPTYGRPEYLQEAIQSVVEQTYRRVEIIVVDDCSPEPVRPQIEHDWSEGDLSIEFVRHDENKGANAARRTGIHEAEGTFVGFLDDDDYWEPTLLERIVDTFESGGSELGVVMVGARFVDESKTTIGTQTPQVTGRITEQLLEGTAKGCSFSQFTVRQPVISDAGLPDPSIPSWQDREWHIRLSQHCEYESIADPLVVRRYATHDQITDDYEQKRDVSYRVMVEKHKQLAGEFGPRCERRFVAYLTQELGFSALRNGYYRESIRQLGRSIRQDPTLWNTYLYLLLAIGGPFTYLPAKRLKYELSSRTQ